MKKEIKQIIVKAVESSGYSLPVGFDVSQPPQRDMGDYATNVALLIAKNEKNNPKDCAAKIVGNIVDERVEKAAIAGAGFINIFLKYDYYLEQLRSVLFSDSRYGFSENGKGTSVNVEFISANPTGPVHIGNARGGPIGQAIANLLLMNGYDATRSFYVNDIGGQIDKLAESFYYCFEKENGVEIPFPEGGYPGDYVKEAVSSVRKKYDKEISKISDKEDYLLFFKDKGVREMVDNIKKDVLLLGIVYDDFIYQSELEGKGITAEVIKTLKDRGATTTREGALWFKDAEGSEDSDDEYVLQKSDGNKTLTYFADDIACHKYKADQGADLMIDLLGPGHHGHIVRMKSSMKAIGIDPERLQIIMYQNVRVKNGDEIIKMSKREGNFVLLRDVINFGVGADAFKYFVLSQNNNTPIDFDVKLATDKSEKNPVYYIQYAYARICSILTKAGRFNNEHPNLSLLEEETEKNLIKELCRFEDVVNEGLESYNMQIFPRYAYSLAALFHEFYSKCRVLDVDGELKESRLALTMATKNVLKSSLDICDITAPEKM